MKTDKKRQFSENLQEIKGEKGIYRVQKMKCLYRIDWNNIGVYMINLDNLKISFKNI